MEFTAVINKMKDQKNKQSDYFVKWKETTETTMILEQWINLCWFVKKKKQQKNKTKEMKNAAASTRFYTFYSYSYYIIAIYIYILQYSLYYFFVCLYWAPVQDNEEKSRKCKYTQNICWLSNLITYKEKFSSESRNKCVNNANHL